jgi:hypothetical protein
VADILDYLATQLGGLIGTPASSAKGLLRLSIKDAFPQKENTNDMRLADFHLVFETSLKARLERVKFRNIDDILEKLGAALNDNQSLITMMRV